MWFEQGGQHGFGAEIFDLRRVLLRYRLALAVFRYYPYTPRRNLAEATRLLQIASSAEEAICSSAHG